MINRELRFKADSPGCGCWWSSWIARARSEARREEAGGAARCFGCDPGGVVAISPGCDAPGVRDCVVYSDPGGVAASRVPGLANRRSRTGGNRTASDPSGVGMTSRRLTPGRCETRANGCDPSGVGLRAYRPNTVFVLKIRFCDAPAAKRVAQPGADSSPAPATKHRAAGHHGGA